MTRAIVKACGSGISGGSSLVLDRLIFGSFDVLAVDERGASGDKRDEVGAVDSGRPRMQALAEQQTYAKTAAHRAAR